MPKPPEKLIEFVDKIADALEQKKEITFYRGIIVNGKAFDKPKTRLRFVRIWRTTTGRKAVTFMLDVFKRPYSIAVIVRGNEIHIELLDKHLTTIYSRTVK